MILVVVRADSHVIERQAAPQLAVDGVDTLPRLGAAGNIRLIGDDDEQQAGGVKLLASLDGFRSHDEAGN
jgi:hypothetical protein